MAFERLLQPLGTVSGEAGQLHRRCQGAADKRADIGLVIDDEDPPGGWACCLCQRGLSRSLVRNHVRRLGPCRAARAHPSRRVHAAWVAGPPAMSPEPHRPNAAPGVMLHAPRKQVKSDITTREIVTALSHNRLQPCRL